MELYGLHALVHDRVPGAVRGMDRVHVGLHVSGRRVMHSVLLGNCSYWKSCGTY